MSELQRIDFSFYHAILFGPHPDWLNKTMLFITTPQNFFLGIGVAVLFIWATFGLRGKFLILCSLSSILLSDPLSSRVLKAVVQRTRPCHHVETPNLLTGCSDSYSFPSSHAVNIFAEATVLSLIYPKTAPYAYLFATLVGYSRVYVGVHYPFDVIGGAAIGILLGSAVVFVFRQLPMFGKIR
ncbi:MAG: phosphatase PAP2 family protein [Leptospirales bacterium]